LPVESSIRNWPFHSDLAIGFDVQIGETMNKMKTHKGTKKRFRKRTRQLRGGGTLLDTCMVKSVTKALGKYSY